MSNNLYKIGFSILLSMGVIGHSFAANETMDTKHEIFTPENISWKDGPDSLPKGAKISVLEGDPYQAGPFTFRIKLPANYVIPPHWHPIIEHVTVISGDIYLGMGETLKKEAADNIPVGGFAYMQPEMRHFVFTHNEAVIQLHGIGPWGITYVNQKDDPRNKQN